MALLQIKLPGQRCSSQWIEDIFYRRYSHLRRLKLSNFKSLEQLGVILDIEDTRAFNLLTRAHSLYGLEWQLFILIHPDGIIKEIARKDHGMRRRLRIPQ